MAGKLQLMTSGSQDKYFTRNPDYSHFVEAFKKHSNFSTQYDDLDPENEADFGKKIKFKIPQNQSVFNSKGLFKTRNTSSNFLIFF